MRPNLLTGLRFGRWLACAAFMICPSVRPRRRRAGHGAAMMAVAVTETKAYQLDGQDFDVFVAGAGGAARPAVLVCHAWGGRSPFEEGKAQKLSELGFVGAAIDLYGVGKRGASKEENQALMTPLLESPDVLQARLAASLDAVTAIDGVDSSRVGVIGFCFGGLCALLMARMGLPLKAAVSFHGLLKVGPPLSTKPRAKMMILHGQDDPMAPPTDVAAFAEEMKRVDADWELHAYPKVVHAFTNSAANDPSFGTVYNADADRRSWAAMKRFLGENLGD